MVLEVKVSFVFSIDNVRQLTVEALPRLGWTRNFPGGIISTKTVLENIWFFDNKNPVNIKS